MTNSSNQALIIPYTAFALSMGILIFSGFIENVPKQTSEEAACIDGTGMFGIFFRIVLPLMRPAISAVAIFTFLQAWNELMFAVVFVSDSKYRTLTVGIQTMSGSYTTKWGPIGAALVIANCTYASCLFVYEQKSREAFYCYAIKE